MRESDVVIVADDHRLEPIRLALGAALQELADPESLEAQRIAVALECLPANWQSHVDVALQSDPGTRAARLKQILLTASDYPVDAYVDVLSAQKLHGIPLLCFGFDELGAPSDDSSPGTSSRTRDGETISSTEHEALKLQVTRTGARVSTGWLRASRSPARQVFMIIGWGHVFSPGESVASLLAEQGFRVTVLVPMLPQWELAIRSASQWQPDRYYEVLPSVIRVPLVSDEEIAEFYSASKREESVYSEDDVAGVERLMAAVSDPTAESDARVSHLLWLMDNGVHSHAAVQVLRKYAESEDKATRVMALRALGLVSVPTPPSVEPLRRALSRETFGDQIVAVTALAILGSEHKVVRDALVWALQHPRRDIRCAAALALAENLDCPARAMSELVDHLTKSADVSSPDETTIDVIEAIGALGSAGSAALHVLRTLTDHEQPEVRSTVRLAVDRILEQDEFQMPWRYRVR